MLEVRNTPRQQELPDPNPNRITESIAIEFFRRLKINRICAGVPKFDIENINFIVSMAKQLNNRDLVCACANNGRILNSLCKLLPTWANHRANKLAIYILCVVQPSENC